MVPRVAPTQFADAARLADAARPRALGVTQRKALEKRGVKGRVQSTLSTQLWSTLDPPAVDIMLSLLKSPQA
jgi:hypothetical protein